jgi:hypothetical protein
MPLNREAVELLIQAARAWYFKGDQHGLHDREWMALRFLGPANRFSRTPTALMPPARPRRRNKADRVQRARDLSLAMSRPAIASAIGWCVAAS